MKVGNGIVVAMEGKTIHDEEVAYDSLDSHLIVDSNPALKHMDLFEIMGAPAATTFQFSTGGTKREELWKIEHKLPFIPRVAVFMLVRDAPPAAAGKIGEYNSQVSLSSFPINEAVYYRVDEKYLYLMHLFSVGQTGQAGGYTSTMQDFKLRIKYMIFNNIGSLEPYEGEFYGL